MAGRRPKPDVLKQLAGYPGKRKPAKGAVPPKSTSAAVMPAVVREDAIAKAEWQRLAPQLELLGLIDSSNQQSFAGYCLSWALFVRAKREIAKDGFTYRTESGQIKKHPAFEAMRAAGSEMRKFAVEHGITPASRTRAQPFTQPTLPGVPEKPGAPNMPADDNEKFFGTAQTLQ